MKKQIWVIQGPNLNLLGEREPELYGKMTLAELQSALDETAATLGVELHHFQTNHEGVLVDKLQEIRGSTSGVLLNAAALTHTSIAIRDAVKGVKYPVVEIHLTNPERRESFRRVSLLEGAAVARFQGEGVESYRKGLHYLIDYIEGKSVSSTAAVEVKNIFRVSEEIHLDDTDGAGVLFNANLFRICHRVYEKWLSTMGMSIGQMLRDRKWGLPIVHIEGDFIKPMRTGIPIEIELRVVRVSLRSITLAYTIYGPDGSPYATAGSTHVAVDQQREASIDIPQAFLEALQK